MHGSQFYLQTTLCLYRISVHQMAPPVIVVTDIYCYLLLIYRPWEDERLSWPSSRLTYGGRFTHILVTRQLQVECRTGKVRRSKTNVLPLSHTTNIISIINDCWCRCRQNYLREQPDNIKSFNIVAETAQFVNLVYSNINFQNIDLCIQLFETLNEFTVVRSRLVSSLFVQKHYMYM